MSRTFEADTWVWLPDAEEMSLPAKVKAQFIFFLFRGAFQNSVRGRCRLCSAVLCRSLSKGSVIRPAPLPPQVLTNFRAGEAGKVRTEDGEVRTRVSASSLHRSSRAR